MSQHAALTIDEQKLAGVWDEHVRAEFETHSADKTVATMVANPRVDLTPVMLGGDGKEGVYEFYNPAAKWGSTREAAIRPNRIDYLTRNIGTA